MRALCFAAAAPSGGAASLTLIVKSLDRILQCQKLSTLMLMKTNLTRYPAHAILRCKLQPKQLNISAIIANSMSVYKCTTCLDAFKVHATVSHGIKAIDVSLLQKTCGHLAYQHVEGCQDLAEWGQGRHHGLQECCQRLRVEQQLRPHPHSLQLAYNA